MPKRSSNDLSTPSAKDRICSQTFLCSSSGSVVMVFFRGDRYCFYGTARIQCLAGDFFVDGYKVPPIGNMESDSMRHVSAPYRFSRPAVFRSLNKDEVPAKYKLSRLRYRLKEITPHYEQIMGLIGEKYPGIVVIDRKPTATIQVLDQVLQDFFVPSWLRSTCQFDRTLFFNGEFQPYMDESQTKLLHAMDEINKKRAEGARCVIVPIGSQGAGKSTLVRHLVNTNLSEGHPIYLLDTDVGQSEFTPPGCLSLWKMSDPILDVPCTHQAQIYPCCYFYGNITPADDVVRYKEIFDRLLNEFQTRSEPGSLLIVNTLGWIDGLGSQILSHIFDVSRPTLALSLSQDRGSFTIPDWVPIVVHITNKYSIHYNHLTTPGNTIKPARLMSYQLRDLAIVSYFSSVLPRPVLSAICDATPYCVKFERITVCIPEDYSYVDDRYFLATLNVQIVALCSSLEDQPLNTRRVLGIDALPLISVICKGSPLLKCHGYGIIRAIDLDKKLFYIITPIPPSELSKINILARGTDIMVPQMLLESQPAGNVLYLSRPALASKSGIIPDLYNGLKNIKTMRREFFPASS
uniref:CLP1_P domain-containing protein n=1 Tax=Haemonchus contortus TaxID=6289 RepID=A0A7I5EAU7_HAECO